VFPLDSHTSASEAMVELGQAFVYCFFLDEGCPDPSKWYGAERRARAACLGVWRDSPSGLRPRPWDFRYMDKNGGRLPRWKDSCPALPADPRPCTTEQPKPRVDDAASVQEEAPDFGEDPTGDVDGDEKAQGAAGSPSSPVGSVGFLCLGLVVGTGALPAGRRALEEWRARRRRVWADAETAMLDAGASN